MSNLTKEDLALMMETMAKNRVRPTIVRNWAQALTMRWEDWRDGLASSKWRPGDAYYTLSMVAPNTRRRYILRFK